MKPLCLALIPGLLLVAPVLAKVPSQEVSWFEPLSNATCTGYSDGHISCQEGRVDGIPKVALDHLDATSPSDNNDKRGTEAQQVRFCDPEGEGEAMACFYYCYGRGYCNSRCNEATRSCQCTCPDETPTGKIPCSQTGCTFNGS
ncbi:hypothetical protein B0T17DRAFT_617570 [Bombardia bombarda]|uniref:Uncharacterized protein n=1 Tax=Bombardia bombarda TaxID=252184 RepID=A0AA39X1Y3_9PEZI|nr:hypothetical protein B0T17DRAFT_617570 [Bombardia bombarda]